jgi:hypothetical protein
MFMEASIAYRALANIPANTMLQILGEFLGR